MNKYLRVYEHIDAIPTNDKSVFCTLLAIGYGDNSPDLCYFGLNQWDAAQKLCDELNRSRNHVAREDDGNLCDCGYPKDHKYKLSCVPF